MTLDNELKAAVFLAGQILPRRPIIARDPQSGITGRFFFKLEMVEDDQVAERGYRPLAQEDIKPGPDGAECVTVTVQLSRGMFLHMPQTGSPWSKLLVFLGPRLIKPILDVFPDDCAKGSLDWISREIHQALEYIGALQEALTRKEALARLPKAVSAFGLKATPVIFSHLRFEQDLHEGRLAQEYKIFGLSADGGLAELTERELQGVLAQPAGIKQLEVVRPDDEGGKVEYSLITGWSGGAILMLPQGEVLPSWAGRPMPNIGLVFIYEKMADIKFTAAEKSAMNTADFATHKFQAAYALALKVGPNGIDASLVGRNDAVAPDTLVRLKLDERAAASQENLVARMVWAARWACSRAGSLQPEEVVKAGIVIEPMEQWPFINLDTIAKEIKGGLAAEAAPQVLQVLA